jgi:hypothetical protein
LIVSVSVCIGASEGFDSVYIPVATQDVYKAVWVVGAHALGLELLPQFEVGRHVDASDLRQLLDELGKLRQWVATRAADLDDAEQVISRIDTLLERLPPLLSKHKTVFFG